MEEPERIGLTKDTNAKLDELLMELNPPQGKEGARLIKFDFYRLAVALAIKNNRKPSALPGNTDNSFRVIELDKDRSLYIAVEASDLRASGEPVYSCIERMAEDGIKMFYDLYSENSGRFPWEEILS